MAGKLAFYKGKLMSKEEIEKVQASEAGPIQAPMQPRPMSFEEPHAQPIVPQAPRPQQYAPQPQMPMPPQQAPIDYAGIKAEMDRRAQEQQEQADAEAYAAAQQEALQAQQQAQSQGVVVTIYLRENLKLDVEVDASNVRQFVEEINEAIGSQMPFQVGSKTIGGRHILFYHIH